MRDVAEKFKGVVSRVQDEFVAERYGIKEWWLNDSKLSGCTTCAPSSDGVNGARGEVASPEGTRKPLNNMVKTTPRSQKASGLGAGEGHGANVSDGAVNGGVFGGVNARLELVRENPGLWANALAALSGKERRTVERYLGALVLLKQVEFRGAPKNGGYYAIGSRGGLHD